MGAVRKAGSRIEELLGGLQTGPAKDAAEELVGLLVDLYGSGLDHVLQIVRGADPALLDELVDDPLVESLLLLHGLHPLDADARVQRALDQVRPYLGSHAGGVEYLGIDEQSVVHLRLAGSCNGCASSALTVRLAIEGAILDAVPEVSAIDVEGVAAEPAPKLLQIGLGPPGAGANGSGVNGTSSAADPDGDGWSPLPQIGPPTGRPIALEVHGVPIIVTSVRGTLYAYRDGCPACGNSLATATQQDALLTCPGCAQRYDVHLAGRGLDDPGAHLDPLPLLSDSHGSRVALPQAAAR